MPSLEERALVTGTALVSAVGALVAFRLGALTYAVALLVVGGAFAVGTVHQELVLAR